jgi:hypothetical protein
MDVYCPRCGEPWELDSLHEEAAFVYGIPYYLEEPDPHSFRPAKVKNPEYDSEAYEKVFREVQREFQSKGCAALAGAFGAVDAFLLVLIYLGAMPAQIVRWRRRCREAK